MTVRDLMEYLEQYDGGAEVRLAEQPSWPFEYSVAGIIGAAEVRGELEEDLDGNAEPRDVREPKDAEPENVVYIVEGSQLAYADKAIFSGF